MEETKVNNKEMEVSDTNGLSLENQTSMSKEGVAMETKAGAGIKATDKDFSHMNVVAIDTGALTIEYHPRKSPGDIESLQASIRRDGLQEPLVVYETGDGKYAVIDGYRRLKVLQEFGWLQVPCMIKSSVSLRDAAHLSYVRNVERSGFNAIEIALHLKAMCERFGYSLSELELKGYGSPPSTSKKMKLLDLPESVQKHIEEGKLTAAHGLHLNRLPTEQEQKKMAKRIIDCELSAKRAGIQIGRYLAKGKEKDVRPKAQIPAGDIPGVYIKDSRDMCDV
jgi:ParB/RepB/Spo0J family partition protein